MTELEQALKVISLQEQQITAYKKLIEVYKTDEKNLKEYSDTVTGIAREAIACSASLAGIAGQNALEVRFLTLVNKMRSL